MKKLIIGVFMLLILIFSLVSPIDYTPLHDRLFYKKMMEKLDTLHLTSHSPTQPLAAGWSQFSIVPDRPVSMAGYGIRQKFETVRDSLYVRILAIDNGSISVYFVTADLLLFPPVIKRLVLQNIGTSRDDFIFFGATHTHFGIGGWEPSVLGNILMGNYDPDWVESVAQHIIEHMAIAHSRLKKSTLYNWEADAQKYTKNRVLNSLDRVDSKIRGITLIRSDSTKALLFAYSAHPTLGKSASTALSNDYITDVLHDLDADYNFTQFMGGMMASHTLVRVDMENYMSYVGKQLSMLIRQAKTTPLSDSLAINVKRLEVEQGSSQLRIAKNWKLRDWVFTQIIGPLKADITLLQLGNILFLGTSCDFSGELSYINHYDSLAAHYGKKLIITSFNGEYAGYITADYLYQQKSEDSEVKELNWVGPYFGQYYDEIVQKILSNKEL